MLTVFRDPTDSAEILDQTCEFKVVWEKGNKLDRTFWENHNLVWPEIDIQMDSCCLTLMREEGCWYNMLSQKLRPNDAEEGDYGTLLPLQILWGVYDVSLPTHFVPEYMDKWDDAEWHSLQETISSLCLQILSNRLRFFNLCTKLIINKFLVHREDFEEL